ncbi:glycosyltransferase family 2 protein [Paenibacillus beijingensis]|uniref:Glycosyl transferase n=1 Tax=Paenibacillus beijingensis TaxID=1126833 RepID=A0A0D5NRZ7_9BACL|nr:glycosyltransferase family 2 protein [Paenibacillus beijingensis]AJY77762.1 glycosyl transferase [Paenibacillus beijingensis]
MRIQWRGVRFRYTRRLLQEERRLLAQTRELLLQQRERFKQEQLLADSETGQLKRRIEESYERLYLQMMPAEEPEEAHTSGRMGDILVSQGVISRSQLEAAIASQVRYGGRLGDILIDMGFADSESLQQFASGPPCRSMLGDLLVSANVITQEQLEQALEFQRNSGGRIGDILLSLKMVEPEILYRFIAIQFQLGRIGKDITPTSTLKLPERLARSYEAVVVHQYVNRFLVAVSAPLQEEQARHIESLLGMPIEQVLATKDEMETFWADVYGSEMMHESTLKLSVEQPHNSAHTTFTKPQIIFFAVSTLLFITGLIASFWRTILLANIAVQLFYFSMSVFKFMIIILGSRRGSQFRFTPEEVAAVDERELPIYTILVPMYKEAQVLPHLLANIESLDYPKSKLDVRILIEEDDTEMRDMLKVMKLPAYYTVLILPDSLPKTKPKACNFGLIRARGEYVVIFDAEDRPDPDQLKKVFLTFRSCPDNFACIQAKLNYFNSEQNLLTRWFTQEYSMWFELLLPGIMKLDVPIPLGGTSNHFKMSVLKQMGAWDPYNVTEDADLGVRLYKHGYKTAIVDSRTWEEANSRFFNWIRQRSRWIKGYMQTWLVHMRNPLRLARELGLKGFLGFQVMVLATPVIPLLNPLFWLMVVLWYGWKLEFIPLFFPGYIYYFAATELFIANFLFVFSNIAGVYWVIADLKKKNQHFMNYSLVKYALLTPLYWVMMSISAYKAAWQLITKPFYWEKTIHGLDNTPPPGAGTAAEANGSPSGTSM